MTFDEWWRSAKPTRRHGGPKECSREAFNARQPEIDALTRSRDFSTKEWDEAEADNRRLESELAKTKEQMDVLIPIARLYAEKNPKWSSRILGLGEQDPMGVHALFAAIESPATVKDEACPECEGQGWTIQPDPRNGEATQVQCEACYGTGRKAK